MFTATSTETAPIQEAALLDLEAAQPGWSGAKEEAIRERFGIEPVRYAVLLERAAHSEEGIAHDPITARRLRDARERSGARRARVMA